MQMIAVAILAAAPIHVQQQRALAAKLMHVAERVR
jgi:hypothetical protein